MTSVLIIKPNGRIWISFFVAKNISFLIAIYRTGACLLRRCVDDSEYYFCILLRVQVTNVLSMIILHNAMHATASSMSSSLHSRASPSLRGKEDRRMGPHSLSSSLHSRAAPSLREKGGRGMRPDGPLTPFAFCLQYWVKSRLAGL